MNKNLEIVLYIQNIYGLNQIENPYNPIDSFLLDNYGSLYNEIGNYLNHKKIDRIYYGSEFCDELIPSISDVKKILKTVTIHNLQFSLVTPCVSNSGIKRLEKILLFLNEFHNIEIICNDFGVLQLIRDKYTNLIPVLGRLIDKTSREPRIKQNERKLFFNQNGIKFISSPNVYTKEYQNILKDYNVNRVEFDCVPQGIHLQKKNTSTSIYFPFYYITTGSICPFRLISADKNDIYNINHTCKKYCQLYNVKLKKSDLVLLQKGNTIYKDISDINTFINHLAFVDRIIIQYFVSVKSNVGAVSKSPWSQSKVSSTIEKKGNLVVF